MHPVNFFHLLLLLRDFWFKVDLFTSSCQEFSSITTLADRVLPVSVQASIIVALPVQVMEPGDARTCCFGQHRAVSLCQPHRIQVNLLFFSMPSLLQRWFMVHKKSLQWGNRFVCLLWSAGLETGDKILAGTRSWVQQLKITASRRDLGEEGETHTQNGSHRRTEATK